MNKYINILIFTVFGLLTAQGNIGFTFFIPIVIYFGFNNIRNTMLIIAASLATIVLKMNQFIVPYFLLLIFLMIFQIVFIKIKSNTFPLLINFVMNIFTYILINGGKDIFLISFYAFLSTVILALFFYNQDLALNGRYENSGFSYNEVILAVIATFGGAKLEFNGVNLGLCVAIYFSIYFCSKKSYYISIFFNIVVIAGLYLMFNIQESFIVMIIGCFYFFPKIISTLSIFLISIFLMYFDLYPEMNILLQATMIIGLFFEIIRFSLLIDETTLEFESHIYENVVAFVGKETVSFASFLDLIDQDLTTKKSYREKLVEAIKELYYDQCDVCTIKKECLNKNKGKLYYFYKSLISNENFDRSFCVKYNDMKIAAVIVRNKYNISYDDSKHEALSLIVNGFSTILKQFAVDASLKEEINYYHFYEIKKDLGRYGFSVSYFNVKQTFINSFLIEVGIVGDNFNDIKDIVLKICNNRMKNGTSIVYKKIENHKIYFNIVPKIKYDVTYGYGSLAPLGNSICGDNYLIKQLDNSRIIAAISDGMGKGLSANIQSTGTLRMIDQITSLNIMADTAMQILNTLIHIQDFQEVYSTLDLVEVNRQEGLLLIYKAGGTTTYLFHENGEFIKIMNENLPFGVEEMIDVKKVKLKNNDLIIIASDGVFENVLNTEDLERFIIDLRHLEPQKLIYELLNHIRYAEVINKDDISIIALKIKAC